MEYALATTSATEAEVRRVIAMITVVMLVNALPFAIAGPMATYIQSDLQFNDTRLGVVLGAMPLGLALVSLPAGRLTDRFGVAWVMRTSIAITIVSAIAAALSGSWFVLAASLFISGGACVLADTGSASWTSRRIPPARHGFTYGIKQSMSPGAAMLGGLAVPIVAATIGWRWGFVIVAGGAAVVGAVLVRDRSADRPDASIRERGDERLAPLLVLGASVGVAQTPVFFFVGFTVKAALDSGLSPTASGVLFAASAALGIACRVALGALVDRRQTNLIHVIIRYLFIGSVGLAAMSTGEAWLIVVACPLGFASLWAWQALVYVFILRTDRNPAVAASILVLFFAVGGFAGSVVFGAIADRSFQAAWIAAAAMPVVAIPGFLAARNSFAT